MTSLLLLLTLLLLCHQYAWADVTSNLVLYWAMSENTGTTLADSAPGGAHPGTLTGGGQTPTWRTSTSCDQRSSCLQFDGSDDQVTLTSLATGSTYTWSGWLSPFSGGSFTGNGSVFTEGSTAGIFFNFTSLKIDLVYSSTSHTSTGILTINDWNHVAVVNNAGAVTFYINGVAAGTATSAPTFNANNVGWTAAGTQYFGRIDEYRLYSRALTASDVTELYMQFADITTGMTLWYKLDDASGTSAADSSGSSLTGTLAAAASWDTAANCKVNGCLSLNGTSQKVTRSSSAWTTYMSTTLGSMTAWVKPTGTAPSGSGPTDLGGVVNPTTNDAAVSRGVATGQGSVDRLWAYCWDGSSTAIIGAAYTAGQWAHVAWVHSNATLWFYVNGTFINLGSCNAMQSGATGTLVVGANYNSSSFLAGAVDEVRLYNRKLTAQDVLLNYQYGVAQAPMRKARPLWLGATPRPSWWVLLRGWLREARV